MPDSSSTLVQQTTKKVLAFIRPNLYQWLNPDNYTSFHQFLLSYDTAALHRMMADEINSHITSFKEWTTLYVAWSNHDAIQSALLEQFFLQFKDEIKDGDALISLLQKTGDNSKLKVLEKFFSLIISKNLLEQCLALMPRNTHERLLSKIPFDCFVSTISELQEIADLFQSDKLRQIIFAQFNPEKLNCTKEEFASLTQLKFELKMLEEFAQRLDPQKVVTHLKDYLVRMRVSGCDYSMFRSHPNKKVGMAIQLISQLQNDSLSTLEKLNALREAQQQIANEYNSWGTTSNSQLYSIISDNLNKVVASEEDSLDPGQSLSRFHL